MLELPAGQASRLKQDLAALVGELQAAIPRAFKSQEYAAQHDAITNDR